MAPALPDTLDEAHGEIRALYARTEELDREKTELSGRLDALSARAAELERQIHWFKKQIFGSKSERRASDPPAVEALTGDLFGQPAEATADEIREETSEPSAKPRRRRGARKPLPAELPRRDILHDVAPDEKICPCCGKEKARIGEDVTEQLEIIPAQVYVARHVRPKYACPSCKDGVAQASLPAQPAPRASVGPGFLAWLILAKYADHTPLCRLERIFARHGVDLPRARMCDWLMTAAALFAPLVAAMARRVRAGPIVQADETSIRLRTGEKRGKTETSWVWVYLGDATAAPYTIYDFQRSRGRDGPRAMLAGFGGCLQSDGYTVYEHLKPEEAAAASGGEGAAAPAATMTRAGCWAHGRRKFVEAEEGGDARASEAIRIIKDLYKVEREWKEEAAEAEIEAKAGAERRPAGATDEAREARRERLFERRRAMRDEKSKPALENLRRWMSDRLDVLPQSPLGKAIGYAENNWPELTRYLADGRLEIDNNASERALRPIAVGRKNWLFAGSERGGRAAAVFFTLIESARRNGLNPFDYLHDLLERLPSHPINQIDALLPDRWPPPPSA